MMLAAIYCYAEKVYQEPEDFLREVFGGQPPKVEKLWVKDELKAGIKQIMEHDLDILRIRYWGKDRKTAWILEEIGKEQPITVGIVVNQGKIEKVKVLVFRESRGWEIRYPFFTDQFQGISLLQDNGLDKKIDGISGATLSVNALTKLARLSLLLHQHSKFNQDPD